MHISNLILKKIYFLLSRMRTPNGITLIVIYLLRGFLLLTGKALAFLQILLMKAEKQYRGFSEEWRYIECKVTVIGSATAIIVVIFFVSTGTLLSFSDINSYIFAGFISIIAIVPSVSLAVIEISSGYSSKLARIYRRSPYFWFLLIIDIVVILVSGLGLLNPNIQIFKTITPIVAFFGIIYLLPYFQDMMRLLDPKRAISKLGQQINLESLLSIVKFKRVGSVPPAEDPIFPLIEIGFKATKERDLETLQLILEEVALRHKQVLISLQSSRPKREDTFAEVSREVIAEGRMREINDHFLNHLRSLKQRGLEEKYEQAVICVIEYFTKLAEQTMQFKFIESARADNLPSFAWIYEIFQLGKENLVYSFWDGTASSLRALAYLSRAAMQNDFKSLQNGVARLLTELSVFVMKWPNRPLLFIPGVILESISDVVKHRMEFGTYDLDLEHEIESMNNLSKEIVMMTNPFHTRMILSRCYEKALFVAIFDFYVKKKYNANKVARVIYDALPAKHLYIETLFQLIHDRSTRRQLGYSQYNPKEAIDKLIQNGLRQVSVESVMLEKYSFEYDARFTLLELSRIFYEFQDNDLIMDVSELLMNTFFSAKKPDDYHLEEIVDTIFALYYACVRLGLISTASALITSLKETALFAARKKLRFSMHLGMLIDYAGAVAIDMNFPALATQAISAIMEFDEYYSIKNKTPPFQIEVIFNCWFAIILLRFVRFQRMNLI